MRSMAHREGRPFGKIGVLTFHRCINYGSYWQARCLVEGLKGMGADAVLLDHQSSAVDWAELRCAFRPALPARPRRSDFPAYALKTRKFMSAFERLPLSPSFPLNRPEEMVPRDAIIIGSDEVWNLHHPWYGGCATFFGEGVRGRLISYAASFGNQDAAHGLPDYWSGQLRNFHALSVRDDNSRRIVQAATGRAAELVLDPCLQFPPRHETCLPEERPHVALYGHSFPDWFSDRVRQWADRHGHRLLSIGYRNDWADEQRIGAGPEEFAGLIAGAEAVITNFFHGCVFALVYQRPFLTAPSAYRFNKVRDLMTAVGAQERMVDEGTDRAAYDQLLGEPVDADVFQQIATLRRRSTAYLQQALA